MEKVQKSITVPTDLDDFIKERMKKEKRSYNQIVQLLLEKAKNENPEHQADSLLEAVEAHK